MKKYIKPFILFLLFLLFLAIMFVVFGRRENSNFLTSDNDNSHSNAIPQVVEEPKKDAPDHEEQSLSIEDIVDYNPDDVVVLEDDFAERNQVKPIKIDEITVFDKDIRGVQGISFNPSNDIKYLGLIASGGWRDDLYVWDYITGNVKYKIENAHGSDILSVKYNADGKYIFSAGLDKKIKVWDTLSGNLIREFGPYDKGVVEIDLFEERDKILIAAALLTGEILVIDFLTDRVTHRFQHPEYATTVAFDINGKNLVSSGKDGIVRLWNLEENKLVRKFDHGAKVNTVAVDPLNEYLLSGGWDNLAKVWDIKTGELVYVLDIHEAAIEAVSFDNTGDYILVGARDGYISLWESATGFLIATYETGTDRIYNVTFDKEGFLIAIAGYDHTVRVYSLEE